MNRDLNSKNKIRLILWTIFSVAIGIFLSSGMLWAFKNIKNEKTLQIKSAPLFAQAGAASAIQITSPTIEPAKPKYFYANADANGQPKVSAKAFLVGDLNTGEVIISKNQEKRFPIASVSKLMTALVTKEINTPDALAQVSKSALATLGKNGELMSGEKIKTGDLIYPLLLESSNDAAEVLAQHFGRDSFISKMNQVAAKLKMFSTRYEDPSGLSPNNQSTTSDLFKLEGYLSSAEPDLFKITTERSYSNKKHSWSNISQFLGHDGYLGGKSGYTDAALQTDVSLFALPLGKTGYRPVAITLLSSNDRKKDVESIIKYLKKNIYYGGAADASTNWVSERIGLPDIQDQNFVTLAFGGDIMLDRGVKNSVIKNFNNDYSALFEKLDILKRSDISFANLEGTATDAGTDMKNLYSFRMDPAVIPALKGAGVSILSLANNHIGDWGRSAFVDTLARLKENEILYTGGGNNKTEAEMPTIIEKYGMEIGFLAFSDKGPDSMAANADKSGILLTNDPDFDGIIKRASKQVDYLIVSFHFGEEYQATHDARQEHLAHEAVDDGAKLIIGSHPHVVEDTEVYKNSLIAYSLGNFVFDQSWSQPTMQGMLLEIRLYKDGSMTEKEDTMQLNSAFQLDKITEGDEINVKFQDTKTVPIN